MADDDTKDDTPEESDGKKPEGAGTEKDQQAEDTEGDAPGGAEGDTPEGADGEKAEVCNTDDQASVAVARCQCERSQEVRQRDCPKRSRPTQPCWPPGWRHDGGDGGASHFSSHPGSSQDEDVGGGR